MPDGRVYPPQVPPPPAAAAAAGGAGAGGDDAEAAPAVWVGGAWRAVLHGWHEEHTSVPEAINVATLSGADHAFGLDAPHPALCDLTILPRRLHRPHRAMTRPGPLPDHFNITFTAPDLRALDFVPAGARAPTGGPNPDAAKVVVSGIFVSPVVTYN